MTWLQTPQFSRDMHKGEEDAVDALLRAAFPGPEEAALVRRLRKSGAIAGETVLPMDDRIVGYYALSRMVSPKGWLCLAPVAMHPDVQGRRLGKRMIGMLTEWARLTGTPVVVVGDPGFYTKAGFSAAQAAGLQSPYPAENVTIAGVGDTAPTEQLVFPPEFGGL
ncbi:GNAT family N-acetyltransferase [Yoonia sp.]|jgi:putative acetyltransferase|uniref:GNAT family N-acetyltransferase n=1 Tax=Yoonia sp. TaxID=2212373 RepID=UPI003F6CC968